MSSVRTPLSRHATSFVSSSSSPSSSIDPSPCWVTPGDLVGSTIDNIAGAGCYVLAGGSDIYAGVVGVKNVQKVDGSKSIVYLSNFKSPSRLPVVGDIVTCRVTKINSRLASVDIICLHSYTNTAAPLSGDAASAGSSFAAAMSSPSATSSTSSTTYLLEESLQGSIRQRDVRAFDIDAIEIYKSFRPTDLVLAQVLSLGDARSYYLSTARNDLGVVLATSQAGQTMVPVNWEQMQCPLTAIKEYRKVAKVETKSS